MQTRFAAMVNPIRENKVNTSQAAFPDLRELVQLFYDRVEDLATFQSVQSGQLPQVYADLLDHDHHMTVNVESHHGCPVDVHVLEHEMQGDTYLRKILLTCQPLTGQPIKRTDHQVVMFGIVRLHTRYLDETVRSEIESRKIPLGRVLIEHNVLRRVELGKLWRVTPGLELQRHFKMDSPKVTFGRTAIIHCDDEPAIELVEIVAPEVVP
jgi:chorismate-pyruvate lyase